MGARQVALHGIAARIGSMTPPHPLRMAIDGIDAAGKTTLADELAELLAPLDRPVIRASVDSFHRPRDERYRRFGALSPEVSTATPSITRSYGRSSSIRSHRAATAATDASASMSRATRHWRRSG
jgi:hypothetical protein